MLRLIFSVLILIVLQPVMAQDDETFEEFKRREQRELQEFKERERREFAEYRKKYNEEFAAFLSGRWERYTPQKGTPAPKQPDPVKPTVAPKDVPLVEPREIPHGDIKPSVIPKKEKPLNIPLPEQSPYQQPANLLLFNTGIYVSMGNQLKFKLNSVSEKDISKIWTRLSSDIYTPLFEDCARICQEMNLNGWATLNLCKTVSEKLLGKNTNEATVLQTYLMAELGYDAQIVRVGSNRLVIACPADVPLCLLNYIFKGTKKYYLWADVPLDVQLHTYQRNYVTATRPIDFSNTTAIALDKKTYSPRTFKSDFDNNLTVTVSIKKSLMEYYNKIPLINDWSFYARQPMDNDLKEQLLPVFRNAIAGKNEAEAANILLHFVQTAFKYEKDDEQFGHEKTDFKEEPFSHRACDCEDRSILYSDLVRTLLGLDVVLLYYPNHLCTAVKFNSDVRGDYINIDGAKYVICDPTYINASIGSCMPRYVDVGAEIYKIK